MKIANNKTRLIKDSLPSLFGSLHIFHMPTTTNGDEENSYYVMSSNGRFYSYPHYMKIGEDVIAFKSL